MIIELVHLSFIAYVKREQVQESTVKSTSNGSGPEAIKLFSCTTQLNKKFILFINVKMPTVLTFISRINTASESFKARKILTFHHLTFYEQLKFQAQLS